VYLGRYECTPVAIKKLKVRVEELDEISRKEFDREARLLTSLRHPNIVLLIAVALHTDGSPMFVLELMEGGSLATHLYGKTACPVPPNAKLRLAVDMGRALCFLHSRKVLHRDLKSDNVLVDAQCERAKLGDLGLARVTSSINSVMTTDTGTVMYMAPEVLLQQSYGAPNDIYGLGLVFFELYMAQRPFPLAWNRDRDRMVQEIVRQSFRPKFDNTKVPESICQVIEVCWQTNPSHRPNVVQVVESLERVLAESN